MNQYNSNVGSALDLMASKGLQDPRKRPIAADLNLGTALPNMDPGKMSASPDVMQSMAQAPQPAAGRTQSFEEFYGSAKEAAGARDDSAFSGEGDRLKGRASGKRTSMDIEAEGLEQARVRQQLQEQASRSLQSRGFAPSSQLGLDYQKDVDRQVAELMVRRQIAQEQGAQQDYMGWLAQSEARRGRREDESHRERQEVEQRRQFDTQQREARQKREWWRPGNWDLETIGRIGGAVGAVASGGATAIPGAMGLMAGLGSRPKRRNDGS